MVRFIEFVISLLIVVAVFVVIALFLPSRRFYTYSVETNRPISTVYDLFNGFSRFTDWNPILRYDKHAKTQITGPEMGKGAKFSYSSRQNAIGDGSWEIVDSVPNRMVKYRLTGPTRGQDKSMTIKLERTGQNNRNVKITQEYRVNYGWDLLGRYAGMYVNRNIGDDVKRGLDKFGSLIATIPKFDYSQHPGQFAFEDVPMQDVLFVSTTARRTNDEIATQMQNQMSWINKVIEANGLVAAGPMRVVTTEFTSDTYAFDIVVPIRRASAPEGTPAGEKMVLSMEGPVNYVQLPARRVATTTYTGPAPGLARVRDLLRAWAMTHGADTEDRPYEEYLSPIESMGLEDAQFKVYWPLKKK
jgi:effector-binding domain-containing protein